MSRAFKNASSETGRLARSQDSAELLAKIEKHLASGKTQYNKKRPDYDATALPAAMKQIGAAHRWVIKNRTPRKINSLDDISPDPLAVALIAAEHAKADLPILLNTILQDAVHPHDSSFKEKMDDLRQIFGDTVADMVCDTIGLATHNLPDIFPNNWSDEDVREYSYEYAKVSLAETYGGAGPIVSRASRTLWLAYEYNKNPGIFTEAAKIRLLLNGEYVWPPLLDLAGYGKLAGEMEDACFRIKDPEAFARTGEAISWSISFEDRQFIAQLIAAHVAKAFGWAEGIQFESEYRPKAKYKAYKKAGPERKNIPVQNLADLHGVRTTLNDAALADWMRAHLPQGKMENLTPELADLMRDEFGKLIRRVHFSLSAAYGRDNKKDKKIQEFFARLAEEEPAETDLARRRDPAYAAYMATKYPHIKDAAFDDGIGYPRNASFLKDALFIALPPKEGGEPRYRRVEHQMLDEHRLEEFMFGADSAHGLYNISDKPAASDRQHPPAAMQILPLAGTNIAFSNWLAARAAAKAGRDYDGARPIYAFTQDKLQIVEVTHNPTVAGFIAAAGWACNEVRIRRPLEPFRPDVTNGPSTLLKNGDVIAPVR